MPPLNPAQTNQSLAKSLIRVSAFVSNREQADRQFVILSRAGSEHKEKASGVVEPLAFSLSRNLTCLHCELGRQALSV